ncbi:hypothetical protein [Streptomyces sp. NPDC093589]|uniref:hypothetical protein n=1 Tax=Streptomyces sp. NPDC093589 TaxID=3366043 RepID=UPI0038029E03
MTPYERLMAEALPTGTFGDARPAPQPRRRPAPADAGVRKVTNPTSAIAAAEHRRVLEAAIDSWEWDAEHRADERRLRLVANQQAA